MSKWVTDMTISPEMVMLPTQIDGITMMRVAEVAANSYGAGTPRAYEAIGFFVAAYTSIMTHAGEDHARRFDLDRA